MISVKIEQPANHTTEDGRWGLPRDDSLQELDDGDNI
jgi:hypothetical protein